MTAVWIPVAFGASGTGTGGKGGASPQIAVQRWTMGNGLVVLLVERHALPAIHAQLLVKTGSVADPVGKAGLAALTASLLDKGTPTRSATEIAEAIDFIGGSLSAHADTDSSVVALTALKKDWPVALGVMADLLLHPSFPAAEVERTRRETLAGILAAKEDPEAVAEKVFAPLVFGPHPYKYPVEGLETTVPTLTREEVVAFHRTYYRPNNAILAVVGDLSASEARRELKRALGAWEKKPIPAVTIPPAQPLTERVVRVTDKDLTQATVVLGHLGISRRDPDFYPVTVMNYILGGGGFASRMMTEVRDNRGLVYGISSGFDARLFPGAFTVSFQTKTASAADALQSVLTELAGIRDKGVTDAELEAAKAYLVGSFPLRFDTNAKLVTLLTFVEFYGLGLDYFTTYPKAIMAVTREDVQRAAVAHINPDRYALVVVGKARDLPFAHDAAPGASQ